jgi:hypothetical protein
MSATATRPRNSTKRWQKADRYAVTYLPLAEIEPSPENEDLYGEVVHDEQMNALIASIEHRGLEEPLILTSDHFILSGHRRFYAVEYLGWSEVPVRIRGDTRREGNREYHQVLAEYNPQRIKRAGTLLREAMLRDRSPEDTYAAIEAHRRASLEVEAGFMRVPGFKTIPRITEKKRPFLKAVQKVVDDLKAYHPLNIRQIHYNLLNDPPLITAPKRSKFSLEKYRYRNDKSSYNALVRLLRSARYLGEISMKAVDDPTRPQVCPDVWSSVSEFVQWEVDGFLTGYERDRQQDQFRHIEVFAEKNTLLSILRPVAREYHVPLVVGRGFCSIPVWRDIAKRFRASGKERMSLLIVSDYDPCGLDLADDAIRSLRDLWSVPIDGHRVAVTSEQIEELDLAEDFNPAKDGKPGQREAFIQRTGSDRTWEVEALPPDYLVEQVKAAIEANLDMELFESVVEQEEADCGELYDIKQQIAADLML